MAKFITQIDGLWRSGNPSEAAAYQGNPGSTVAGGPSNCQLIAEGMIGATAIAKSTDIQLDASYGVVLIDSTSVMPSTTTALAGSGTVMTYTIANTVAPTVAAGMLVTVAGATPSGFNGTNLLVATASTTTFTVAGAATGPQTVAGTVTITAGAFRTVYTPAAQYDNGAMWLVKKTNNDGNRVLIYPFTGTMDGLSTTNYSMGAGQNSTATIVSDGSKYYIADRYDAPCISTAADPLTTGGTISPGNMTYKRVAPAGAVTGVIMNNTGVFPFQECTVFNESANLITFATSATSHVLGTGVATIPINSGRRFVWNGTTSLWIAC